MQNILKSNMAFQIEMLGTSQKQEIKIPKAIKICQKEPVLFEVHPYKPTCTFTLEFLISCRIQINFLWKTNMTSNKKLTEER